MRDDRPPPRGGHRSDGRAGDRRPDRGGDRRPDERRGGDGRGRPDGDRRRDDRPRPERRREPDLPEGVDAGLLDRSLRSELRTLSKENAEVVGGHLVMVGRFLDQEDFDAALAHAETASARAGRIAGVREALGVVYYRRGEWGKALAEFRTARRLSGSHHLLPLIADTERGLGRPERALELASSPEASTLGPAERVELAIVVSGARSDLGESAAAVLHLRGLVRGFTGKEPWAARLAYAYAAALEQDGQGDQAQEWFATAADADAGGDTDAGDLLGRSEEPLVVDLGDDDKGDD